MSFVDEGPAVGISVDIGESVDVAGLDFVDSDGTESLRLRPRATGYVRSSTLLLATQVPPRTRRTV